jgi:hypothetical protein
LWYTAWAVIASVSAALHQGDQCAQCRHQVDQRAPPAVELPDQNHIKLALRGGLQEGLPLKTMICGARGNLLDGVCHRPVPSGGTLAQGVHLHGEGVLIVRGDTGIEGSAHG